MADSASISIARRDLAGHRLTVLIALGDAARAERLSTALAATDDLLPVMAGNNSGLTADVAVVDEGGLELSLIHI